MNIDNLKEKAVLHGNGFLQMDLSNKYRLHIFHPDLIPFAQKVRTTYHTHFFDMTSSILYGTMIHKHMGLISGDAYKIYSCVYDGNRTKDSSLERSLDYPGTYGFRILSESRLAHGSEYFFASGLWHESTTEDLTVTVIRKDNPLLVHQPLVACPINDEPDNEYKRDAVAMDIVDQYVELVKSKMKINELLNLFNH